MVVANENQIPVLGKSVISELEFGINTHGVDKVFRIAVINQAMGVALLTAAGEIKKKLRINLSDQIRAFESYAVQQELVIARCKEVLDNPNSGLTIQQELELGHNAAIAEANAEYVRSISMSSIGQFVKFILSQSDLTNIALEVGRRERGRIAGGVKENGHYITKGLASIQY